MLNTYILILHTVIYVIFEWFKVLAWQDGPGYRGLMPK